MEITYSPIVPYDVGEALGSFVKPTVIQYMENPMEKHGTDALKIINVRLAALLKRAYYTFADGVQLSDVTFIPSSLGDVIAIGKQIPNAIKEIKDLDIDEIVEVVSFFTAEVAKFYSELKNKPISTK